MPPLAFLLGQCSGERRHCQESIHHADAHACGAGHLLAPCLGRHASAHLLRNRALALSELPEVLARSADKFTDYHVQTLKTVMRSAALIEPPINAAQQQLIDAVDAYFAKKNAAKGPWSAGT